MKPADFDYVAKLLKDKSGLIVTQDKTYLLESRLMPVARKYNAKTLDDLIDSLRKGRDQKIARDVVEAMTTNESFFFRDIKPFDQFRDVVLPYLIKARAGKKHIRIWSAACSSGQEPYSLAMLLREKDAQIKGWRIEILGTDISTEILEKAKAGVFSQFEVQRGLAIQMLVKYFQQQGEKWRIDSSLRSMVQFKEFNLLDDPRGLGQFDVIFCRNVLIYFDQATKTKVLDRLSRIMAPDGFLYLGGAETVLGISDRFSPLPGQRGLYCLSAAAGGTPMAATGG